jgi:hypothetical protein
LTLLTRSLANLALVLMAGLACVAPPALRTGERPTAVVQLSPAAVSPGTWIRVQGAGFRVGEYVEIVVTDPAGTQTRLGKLIADGQGDIEAEVAPGDQVRNGVTVITLSGTESERTAAVPINLTGGSDAGPAVGQPQWTFRSDAESACEQCLLVHGQAP